MLKKDIQSMTLKIEPAFVLRILLSAIFILLCLNTMGIIYLYNYEVGSMASRIITWVHFDREANIPTFYSAVNLVLASLLLLTTFGLSRRKGDNYLGWLGLGIVFMFLAFDEAASLHEALIGISQRTFNTSGYLYYAWFIPYVAGLIILVLIYIPFLKKLPKRTFWLFAVSGAIFLAGAVGFEMIGGKVVQDQGFSGLYAVCSTLEETLEMVGIALFIFSILDYLEKSFDPSIRIGK
jgi:hypothetical protein